MAAGRKIVPSAFAKAQIAFGVPLVLGAIAGAAFAGVAGVTEEQ